MNRSHIVVGLGFGDEGKGTIVDALVKQTGAKWVCRYNGGAQAAHHVTTDDGRKHRFSQFGAGSFHPGVNTYLSEYMLIDPMTCFTEAESLANLRVTDCCQRLFVDPDCLVVTPVHKFLNRVQETVRGDGRHGSCGMGIGAARELEISGKSTLRMRDLREPLDVLAMVAQDAQAAHWEMKKHRNDATDEHWNLLSPSYLAYFVDCCRAFYEGLKPRIVDPLWLKDQLEGQDAIWEGAQGTLLCEHYGFPPHYTWTRCNVRNAMTMAQLFDHEPVKIGVLRSYGTRHGAGPFPTEEPALAPYCPEPHNAGGGMQGGFRVGYLDLTLTAYALAANRWTVKDRLAVTHMDTWANLPAEHRQVGEHVYESEKQVRVLMQAGERRHTYEVPGDLLEHLESELGAKVGIVSRGPKTSDKRWIGQSNA